MSLLIRTDNDRGIAQALTAMLSASEWRADAPLSGVGRWKIGGPADYLVTPASVASLRATLQIIARFDVPHVIIGDGSNLLFDDAGFRGIVLRIGRAFDELEIDRHSGRVRGGAGLWVPSFVRQLINAGLKGLVHAVGIPGTLGGLCVMNGGSQRRGVGEHLVTLDAIDHDGVLHRFTQDELHFAYRQSRLQEGGLIALSAEFQLQPGDAALLRREAIEVLAARRAKFPRVTANCGSVFVSDPKLYALIGPPGLAIERAGLKGRAIGDAQISPDHANFIVNNGHARSADVLALIAEARQSVYAMSGVAMDAEVRHLDPFGCLRPAHEVADPTNFIGKSQDERRNATS